MKNRRLPLESKEISPRAASSAEASSIHRWGLPLLMAAVVAGSVGCAANHDGSEEGDSPIYGGTRDAESAAVLALRVQWPGKTELCSGTLIAPNVVLTARHCVSQQIVAQVSCDDRGRSLNGPQLGGDVDPSAIRIFTGIGAEIAKVETARGKAIFHPEGSVLCNGDIALVVLDTPLETIEPLAVRRDGKVSLAETVRTVGFGRNDLGTSVGTRISRPRVGVIATGSGISKYNTALGANEFEVGLSSCNGDSGGPAISEATGAVIGVVSRGGDCTSNFGHVYTSTVGFDAMFDQAFGAAEATPVAEELSAASAEGTGGSDPGAASTDGPSAEAPPPAASGCSTTATQATRLDLAIFLPLLAFFARRTRRSTRRSA